MFGDISNKLSVKGAKTSTSSDDPYGDKDEIRSVYSVDPDMLEKLQIKKPKKGEEMSNYDAQKLLIFQLKKDLPKIVKKTGSYASKVKKFNLDEKRDLKKYAKLNTKIDKKTGEVLPTRVHGADGNMSVIARRTEDISWRATSKPHGIIAEKRYQEYLRNIPKGPSEYEILQKKQALVDKQLWEMIKMGQDPEYIDGIKVKRKGREEHDQIMEFQKALAAEKADKLDKEENFRKNNFGANRVLSKKSEYKASLLNWHRGIHFPYNFDEGFPSVPAHDLNVRAKNTTIDTTEKFIKHGSIQYSTTKYIPTDGTGQAQCEFQEYLNLVCHKRAEVFLEKVRKQQKLDEKARKAAEKKLLRKSLKLNVKIEKIPEQEYPNEGVHTSASKIESELGSTNGQTLESGGEPDLIRINSGMVMSNVTGLGHSVVFDNNLDANTKANQLGLDLTALGQENVGTEGASEFQISKNFERSEIEDENSTHWSTNDSAIEIMKSFKTKVDNWLSGKMNFKGKVKINEARVSPYEVEETTDKISVKIPEEPDEIIEKPDNELDIVSQSTKRRRMEAREKQRRAKMPWYMVIKEVFWSVVGVQENKETLLERRKREEEAQKKVQLADEMASKVTMELMFKQRAIARNAENTYNRRMAFLSGVEYNERIDWDVDDLIAATRRADYNTILDILDDESVHPNSVNEEGESAFYIALMSVLDNEVVGNDENNILNANADMSLMDRFRNKFKKKQLSMKLDLIISILLYKGGNVNFVKPDKSADGLAVIHIAAGRGSIEMITWLLNKKANINLLSYGSKTTALMEAVKGDFVDVSMYLLKRGAMMLINHVDEYGRTALHYAALFGSLEHAEILLICGAKKDIRSKENKLPVEEAKAKNRHEMALLILNFKPVKDQRTEKMEFLDLYDLHGNVKKAANASMEQL